MCEKYISQPFWHLSPIAVYPECQGKGYGSELLKSSMEMIKNENGSCYIETQSEKNCEFYKKFGFVLKGKTPLEGSEIVNYSMVFNQNQ